MGFLSMLGVLFIALKLMSYIDWSWWLVLLPLYAIPVIILAVGAGALTIDTLDRKSRRG